ncbi:MAG: hypothetical protein WD696_04970 [Bryobacteraceae bacterium]
MSREQFIAGLVKSPQAGEYGEAVFDFSAVAKAPCSEFVYTPECTWDNDDDGEALTECWRAYLEEFEYEYVD